MQDPDYEFFEIGEAAGLPPGERLFIDLNDQPVVIFNVNGDYFAIDDECTHDNNPLGSGELEGYCIICPRHGARFDIRSGKVMRLPAVKDLNTYPVCVEHGMLQIGIKKEG